jgi:hypothetical protein
LSVDDPRPDVVAVVLVIVLAMGVCIAESSLKDVNSF